MTTKIILPFLCLVAFFCHFKAESRTISMYDLQPAAQFKKHDPSLGDTPIFKNCSKPSDLFQLTNVKVEGCTAPPCPLIKGKNVTVEIDFIAHAVVSKIKSEVYGQIAGVKVPFPLTNDDACNSCGIQCPTKVGNTYHFNYSLPVSPDYPAITLAVFWYFEDPEQNVEELCMDVAATIKSQQ